jgi:hypothetical protein
MFFTETPHSLRNFAQSERRAYVQRNDSNLVYNEQGIRKSE